MTKNKLILIISAVILIVIFFVIIIIGIIFNKNKSTSQVTTTTTTIPSIYSILVNISAGNYSMNLINDNGQTTALNASTENNYLLSSFNQTHDILNLSCPDNYSETNAVSPDKLNIVSDPTAGSNIEFDQNLNAQITITCSINK